MSERPDLENTQVLNLVQALLGSIDTNLRAVAVKCDAASVDLYFVVRHDSEECREVIEDIASEFGALQLSNVDVRTHVTVDDRGIEMPGLPRRLVFVQRE